MYRSNECGKHSNPTMSTLSSETRPSSSFTPQRRRLVKANFLLLGNVSPNSEPLRSVSPGFRYNSPKRHVSPEYSPDSPDYRPDSPDYRPGSPDNRPVSPDSGLLIFLILLLGP